METISISDFRSLLPRQGMPAEKNTFGLFSISIANHVHQCENLKVGDEVSFMRINPVPRSRSLAVRTFQVQAIVVEG